MSSKNLSPISSPSPSYNLISPALLSISVKTVHSCHPSSLSPFEATVVTVSGVFFRQFHQLRTSLISLFPIVSSHLVSLLIANVFSLPSHTKQIITLASLDSILAALSFIYFFTSLFPTFFAGTALEAPEPVQSAYPNFGVR